MVRRVLRHLFVFVGLISLTLASTLQFTHDTRHEHSCYDDKHAEKEQADVCALCWFLAHQISSEFNPVVYLPRAAVNPSYAEQHDRLTIAVPNTAGLVQSGRGPPILPWVQV